MNLLLLGLMFRDEEKRMQFLVRCALAFDVRFDTLCELLNMDAEKLTEKLCMYDLEDSMHKVDLISYRPRAEAKKAFLQYYNELGTAFLNRDKEKIKGLMNYVDDSGIKIIKGKVKNGLPLTDSEVLFLVKYQVMHRMSKNDIYNSTNYLIRTYRSRIKKLEEEGKNPDLFAKLRTLTDYNMEYAQFSPRGRK